MPPLSRWRNVAAICRIVNRGNLAILFCPPCSRRRRCLSRAAVSLRDGM
ncbi:hypothetical protein KCP76_22195 [Salmonella enterica subsp. enterica serovar Weltevreden]|nr:hypothetical protein KCP76_22195 [Salmonella enterica subsp. enterica serovar Weltevreden]